MKNLQIRKFIYCILVSLAISPCPAIGADYMKGVIAAMDGDYERAYKEWKPLAQQDEATPQFQVGWLFEYGFGVSKNYEEAFFWYQQASENGYAYAQTALGRMYEFGRGVRQDHKKAYMWYSIALELWDPTAGKHKTDLSARMTADQITNAKMMKAKCIQAKFKGCS